MTAPAAKITRPELDKLRRPSPCERRPRRPSAPWRTRAGRPCSPSRSRRSSRRRTPAPRHRGSPAARSRAIPRGGRPGRSTWRPRRRRRWRAGWLTTPIAAATGAWNATSSTRKPSASDDADDHRRLGRQRGLEVVVLGRGAADQRARGQPRAQAIDRRVQLRARGIAGRDRLDQHLVAPARLGRQGPGDARVAPAARSRPGWRAEAGATIWRAPGAPGPKPAWICS